MFTSNGHFPAAGGVRTAPAHRTRYINNIYMMRNQPGKRPRTLLFHVQILQNGRSSGRFILQNSARRSRGLPALAAHSPAASTRHTTPAGRLWPAKARRVDISIFVTLGAAACCPLQKVAQQRRTHIARRPTRLLQLQLRRGAAFQHRSRHQQWTRCRLVSGWPPTPTQTRTHTQQLSRSTFCRISVQPKA